MFDLFRKSNNTIIAPHDISVTKNADTKIRYNPELINQFFDEHKNLLSLFAQLDKAVEQGNVSAPNKWLRKFTAALRTYLLTKNLHLFVYLQHAYKNDHETLRLIKEYKREMRVIGRGAEHLVTKYKKAELNDVEIKAFAQDLEHLGKILVQQIDSEEAILYPLYLQLEEYALIK